MRDTFSTLKAPWLVASFVACFLAGAWLFWRGSYVEYLNNAGSGRALLLLLGAVALLMTWFIGSTITATGIAIGSVFPAVIFGRLFLDGPTDHNLWPFEVGEAFILSAVVAFSCAAIGSLLRRVTHRARLKTKTTGE